MFSRESLWTRIAGRPGWAAAWAVLLASALPWLIPEIWDGVIPKPYLWAGWITALGSFGLLRVRGLRYVGLCVIVLWGIFLGLSRIARWEAGLPTGYQELEGVICEPWQSRGFRLRSGLSVTSPLEMKGMTIPLSVPSKGEAPPGPGTPVRFKAELRSSQPGPAFMAERPLWRARNEGKPRQIALSSALIMETLGPPEPGLLLRYKCWMMDRFQALPIEGAARDLWGALALGIHPINDEVTSAFAESGTLHLLVVSGLQITLIMVAIEWALRKFLRRGSGLGAILGGLAFAALVGFTAPIWRGLLMGAAWVFGRAHGWRVPPAISLHLALLLWLLLRPASGVTPGFLLGWWAMLGLIWVSEPLQGLISPLLGRASRWLAHAAAPWSTTLPLLALFNGGVSAWGILTNILVLPFVWLLTPLCLALTLLPIPILVRPATFLLQYWADNLVPAFAKIIPLATGILWPWIVLVAGWFVLAQFHAALRKSRALTACLLAATVCLLAVKGTGSGARTLTLDAPDIGQGDALLLRIPNAEATLIDTGPTPWSARRLVRVLSRRGVREPINLVITHPHADHAGGWITFERLWPTASTAIPVVASPDKAWAEFAPDGAAAEALHVRRGDFWTRGDAQFSVRWPPKPFQLPDPNMLSIVMRVRWDNSELWFMGDALAIQERDMIDLGDPEPWEGWRLLKAGHHGGLTATSQEWINALKPNVALFTTDYPNRFNFPAPEVLNRCRDAGAEILITGPFKGLRVEAKNDGWAVSPFL
ncbi:MAG: ComEC/Rec2 family competence protein [Holophagales bacterium]|nr:ComEC/Rec2 family competence protein [Holophagales bacterium]